MGNALTPSSTEDENSKVAKCNIYVSYKRNQDSSFLGVSGFEGIPQNLVLNLIGWFLLQLLFIILRKKAWNYGRIAVMQKEEIKWTDMFYGGYKEDDLDMMGKQQVIVASAVSSHESTAVAVKSLDKSIVKSDDNNPSDANRGPVLPKGESKKERVGDETGVAAVGGQRLDKEANVDAAGNIISDEDTALAPSLQNATVSEIRDKGYFSWIKIVYGLTDEQYIDKCGLDCVFYLSFQRHLIVLAFIITVCCLAIILPINLHNAYNSPDNKLLKNMTDFSDTTIINLSTYHNYLWAHILLSIGFLFVSIFIMRHYSKRLQFTEADESDISRTVLIYGLNKKNCRENLLRAHFAESYRGSEISEISFAFDISKLQVTEFKRLSAVSAKIYFQEWLARHLRKDPDTPRPKMRPFVCGAACGCCCCCRKCRPTDAIDYYAQLEDMFTVQMEVERQKALEKPLGIAFVTFSSVESAERIVEDYACSARLFLHTPVSAVSKDIHSSGWVVKYASPPEDILWENLTLDFRMWYVKFVLINLVLLVIVVIFTTPVYFFQIMDAAPKTAKDVDTAAAAARSGNGTHGVPIKTPLGSVIRDTLPTILMWIISITMIWIVYRSDLIIGFWTKTAGNLSEMIKTFIFLTLMVIVLPSLGVTSVSYFLDNNSSLVWSCIFYKENGALFVNYICTSSLVGTAAELMRLPELFIYAIKLSFARSKAEMGSIRKSVLWDFQIGTSYAWTMLHFAIFTCFSVIYPLVTPFGLLYLILKHWTDRYNIYFAYAPCKVSKEVHGTAVNFVIMCMFMLQINLLAYVHFHLGNSKDQSLANAPKEVDPEIRALQVFSLLGFSVTAALFLGQLCFNVCADFSPITHYKSAASEDDVELMLDLEAARNLAERNGRLPGATGSDRDIASSAAHRLRKSHGKPNVATSARESVAAVLKRARDLQVSATHAVFDSPSPAQRQRSDSFGSTRSSGGGNRHYGRYIPPLLKHEFARGLRDNQSQNSTNPISPIPTPAPSASNNAPGTTRAAASPTASGTGPTASNTGLVPPRTGSPLASTSTAASLASKAPPK